MDFELLPDSLLTEVLLLICAFVLSAVIGVEREVRQKSAGVRTHILVGMGSALFTLVSAYGFSHLLGDEVMLDPSRIAAQIVSGIGFIGAGVIFVRQNIISGLTTAASIWVTAAVGMACGAGMPVIAALTVLLYVVAVTLVTAMVRKLPQHGHTRLYSLRYADGHGILRDILSTASDLGYEAALAHAKRQGDHNPVVEATMRFTRRQQSADEELFRRLSEIDGVHEVRSVQQDHD
ncbi:MgtC/SapB family protein [Nesterenkonia massiliensis]|uniref:MgtC/SapB family protein n=1 Tax=Nesterenkonia massiliensis TaxID=1232429 RepID=A0ABT2HN14_9MICC|nr:MgtC/SapB family protein [Nesterenkonia massiliensis]MCT1606076.1 MgtC/SapB family protein [Nesterenkonia massiliensis]